MRQRFANIALLLLFVTFAHAQKVSNANCYEKDNKIYITYSLSKEADISVSVSVDGEPFRQISTRYLSGDVGTNVKAGTKKTIIWDVLSEKELLVGDVRFSVTATESLNNTYIKSSGNQPLTFSDKCNNYYATTGVADVALFEIGVATALKRTVGYPITVSLFTLRYKLLEVAPASFTYDIRSMVKSPQTGLYWKPQARLVIPLKDNFAFVPSVGPSLDIFNPTWWFVLTVHFRYLYGNNCHIDFYAGYEDDGFSLGVTAAYTIPLLKK